MSNDEGGANRLADRTADRTNASERHCRVLLTLSAVGVAIEIQERLERVGHQVTWDTDRRGGGGDELVDIVILPGGDELAERIGGWRASASVPALLVLGSDADTDVTTDHGVTLMTSTERLGQAVEQALSRRFGTAIALHVARAALGLGDCENPKELARKVIVAGRSIEERVVRDALEPKRRLYVTATEECLQLRETRTLDVPEIELTRLCTGARTLQSVVAASSLEPLEAGQRVWALASAGALRFDPEPPAANPECRRVRAARAHIRSRSQLPMPTAYDVLDVTRGVYVEDIEEAVQHLGFRFAPQTLEALDVGDLADVASAQWHRVLESREALYYEAGQSQLNAFIDTALRQDPSCLSSSWGHPSVDARTAATAFTRGQAALSSGEVFKAVSDMAAAARAHPNHPVYEAYLAWTRYRADVARGADRGQTAKKERAHAESAASGRRPFAQALIAIGLLCVADGDATSARWHLTESLALNPELPTAKLILARLSG